MHLCETAVSGPVCVLLGSVGKRKLLALSQFCLLLLGLKSETGDQVIPCWTMLLPDMRTLLGKIQKGKVSNGG